MAPEVVQALLTEQPVIQEIVVTVHFQDLVADHTGPTGPGHHFFEMLMERKYVITHKDIVKSGVSCEYTFVYLPSMYPDGYVMPPPQKEEVAHSVSHHHTFARSDAPSFSSTA